MFLSNCLYAEVGYNLRPEGLHPSQILLFPSAGTQPPSPEGLWPHCCPAAVTPQPHCCHPQRASFALFQSIPPNLVSHHEKRQRETMEVPALNFPRYKTRAGFSGRQSPLAERTLQRDERQISEVLSSAQPCSHSRYESSPPHTKKLLVHHIPGNSCIFF